MKKYNIINANKNISKAKSINYKPVRIISKDKSV